MIIWLVVSTLVQFVHGQQWGARPDPHQAVPARPGECQYTFTVTAGAMKDTCRTQEVNDLVKELQADYKAIQQENTDLKKEIDSIRNDYESMVEGVKKLEGETASWRQIIEWPQIEMPFQPDNASMIIMKEPNFPDCYQAWQSGNRREGIYMLKPPEAMVPFFAYCDKEGWSVFQRRFDGTVDFYKKWDEYSRGFGRLSGEFWLGLENMFLLTDVEPYELRVEALGWNGKLYHCNYDNFRVLSELKDYKLLIGNMTKGNTEDVLSGMNGTGFTTWDRDNDKWYSANCAEYYRGAFWLPNCGSDPNRRWCETRGCMSWGDKVIKKTVIKIRPMSIKNGAGPSGRRQPESPYGQPYPGQPKPDYNQPPPPEYPRPPPPEYPVRPETPERPEYPVRPESSETPEYTQPDDDDDDYYDYYDYAKEDDDEDSDSDSVWGRR